jgi:hypothetical protein
LLHCHTDLGTDPEFSVTLQADGCNQEAPSCEFPSVGS